MDRCQVEDHCFEPYAKTNQNKSAPPIRPTFLVVTLSYLEKALKLGFLKNPDFAVITGDFITKMPTTQELAKYEKLLKSFANKIPIFACLGNHDGGTWAAKNGGFPSNEAIRSLLSRAGIVVLQNKKKEIHIRGQRIDIVGLGDLWSRNCQPNECLQNLVSAKNSKKSDSFA